jgi:cytidylate kinase
MQARQMTHEEAAAFVAEKDALVADFTRDSHGLSPDDLAYFDLVIDTGKVSRDSAVRILVEAVGALTGDSHKGPTAAELQVDSVWEKDVSYEFERVARLRG